MIYLIPSVYVNSAIIAFPFLSFVLCQNVRFCMRPFCTFYSRASCDMSLIHHIWILSAILFLACMDFILVCMMPVTAHGIMLTSMGFTPCTRRFAAFSAILLQVGVIYLTCPLPNTLHVPVSSLGSCRTTARLAVRAQSMCFAFITVKKVCCARIYIAARGASFLWYTVVSHEANSLWLTPPAVDAAWGHFVATILAHSS